MLEGKSIIAIVPARSGSKGIPHKNMRLLGGVSLIGWAGKTLRKLAFIDKMIISTDSPEYVREAERYGLEAPFLRPAELSTDEAGAIETIEHALREAEKCYSMVFEVILIIEPTSPFRLADDIERITRRLLSSGADSVVAVSPLPPKAHPKKVLEQQDGFLRYYLPQQFM